MLNLWDSMIWPDKTLVKTVSILLLLSLVSHHLEARVPIDVTYYIAYKSSSPLQIPLISNDMTAVTNDHSGGPGIITDIIELINDPSIKFHHQVLPFRRMLRDMREDNRFWITYGSSAWPGPQSTSLSTTPVVKVRHQFLTLAGTEYRHISDFFGQRLILIRNFDYPGLETYIDQGKFEITYVSNHTAAIKALFKGRGVAFPEMNFRLQYHLKRMGIEQHKIQRFDIEDIIPDYNINLCFSENFPKQQRSLIENRLTEMVKSGQMDKIIANYTE